MAAMSDEVKFYAEEELVASAPSRKNWRGMLIAIVVILAVCGLIVTAVILMTPVDDGQRVKGLRFTLDDILSQKYQPALFNGSWLQDDQLIITDSDSNLQVFDPRKGFLRPLLANITLNVPKGSTYSLSSDNRYLLLTTNHKKKPAQNEEFEVKIYDLTTGIVYPIPLSNPEESIPVQAIYWSPYGSSLVYVQRNDIYYVADVTSGLAERLTTDGMFNLIYNGIPDWTYKEDILKNRPAIWFSENGDHLLYISFNDSAIPELTLPVYSEPDTFHLYTEKVILRYPTPMSPIPKVNLRVVDLTATNRGNTKELRPPLSIRDQEYYLTSVQWVNNQRVCAVWTLRAQNLSLISICDAGPWHCQTVHTIETGMNGWLNLEPSIHFHSNGNSFVHLAPVQVDDTDYYTNIIYVDTIKRDSWPITRKKAEIYQILGWDTKRNLVYFIGSCEKNNTEKHLYALKTTGQKIATTESQCLTCSITARPFDNRQQTKWTSYESIYSLNTSITSLHPRYFDSSTCCQYSQVLLSPSLDYYVHQCLGPSIPYSSVRSLPDNQFIRLLQSNDELNDESLLKAFPRIIKRKVPLLMDNTPWSRNKPDYVSVQLYLPPGLVEDEGTVYPLVIWASDEPGTHQVTDEWKVDWATYMSSARDVIVAKVDVHGSNSLGHNIRNAIYRQPGSLESVDLIEITKFLQQKFPYISPVKTALLGSHYGGYISVYTLERDVAAVFGCGIAISPITSWHIMPAPFSERYLGLLNDREGQRSYLGADLTSSIKTLQNRYLFLVHGTLEEKFQATHSFLLAKSLIQNRFPFQQQFYPDANYETLVENIHLYEAMNSFLNDCFDRREPPEAERTLHKGE